MYVVYKKLENESCSLLSFRKSVTRSLITLGKPPPVSRPISKTSEKHCVKSVRILSYSGPYFPAFGLNTERYSISLCIQSECGKMRTRITPNTDTFHAVKVAA